MPVKPDYQRVADHIAAQIAAGVLQPGDQLPSYKALAAEYEVGVSTIRSALLVLRLTGVVVGHPGRGTFVAQQARE